MAVVSPHSPLDAAKIKLDFPILATKAHGTKPLVYLDSANSSQKPEAVIEAVADVYRSGYANVHRGVYELGVHVTEAFEGARDKVAAFINAPSRREVMFVRQATEALNLVAYAYGRKFIGEGDVIVTTEMEHHSNLVPWQFLAQQTGATLRYIRITDDGELDPASIEELGQLENVKLVAVTQSSNTLGTLNDIPALSRWAHELGAVIVVDGAQAAPHRPVDVQALGCDFYAISGHKMCGPGSGALWGREELLERMDPFLTGGEMIQTVTLERTTWNELPWKFEAGTPAIAECIGLGAAIDYLSAVGLDRIAAHEHALTEYGYALLDQIDGVTQFGPPAARRGGVLSFDVAGIHPHDVAQILDGDGICVRAGHHCTQPVMARYGVAATTRASVYLYNTTSDLDALAEGLERVKSVFAR